MKFTEKEFLSSSSANTDKINYLTSEFEKQVLTEIPALFPTQEQQDIARIAATVCAKMFHKYLAYQLKHGQSV